MPILTGKPPRDASRYMKILNTSLEMFENYFLSNTALISSNDISIADLMAITEFSQLEVRHICSLTLIMLDVMIVICQIHLSLR